MAILANEKVLTLDYWKPARLLEVGDYVFDRTGNLVKVKLVQEYRAQRCYQVTFSDNLTMSGDENLGFPAENPIHRQKIVKYKQVRKFTRKLRPVKVKQILDGPLKHRPKEYKYSIQTAPPLELPHQTLPVPPFVFGFWFFNRKTNRMMTPPKGFSADVHEEFKSAGYKLTEHWLSESGEREFATIPTIESHLLPNIPYKIPNNYLLADVDQRIALLRGIIYSKPRQYNVKKDRFQFSNHNLSVIQQVQALAESLGHKTNILHNARHKAYTLFFKSRLKLISNQASPPLKIVYGRRYIRAIEEISPQTCVHIETTAPDNTLLVGEGFISTC
jgi:hypothetical protein